MSPSLARGEGSREAPGAKDGEAVVVLRTPKGAKNITRVITRIITRIITRNITS